ncbi:hypothetical protein LV779_36365 [Streptomyces thinghirensis]|nr:hypothetical protein [Streptomyces thinghirensis]
MPYQFAAAFAPLHGLRRYGAMALVWSASHPPSLTPWERGQIQSSARRLTQVLDQAPASWSASRPAAHRPLHRPDIASAQASSPPSTWSSDCPSALSASTWRGASPISTTLRRNYWPPGRPPPGRHAVAQAVPWLDDPVHEEHYRAAVLANEPVAFTALRLPGNWLDFRLYRTRAVSASSSPAIRTTGIRPTRHHPVSAPRSHLRKAPARGGSTS